MDDYTRALHSAILRYLNLTSPPYRLNVDVGSGDVRVELRDATNIAPNDPSGGKFIHGLILNGDLRESNIPATAREAADEIRPHLSD